MNKLSLYDLSTNYLQALDFLTDPEMDLPIEAVNDTLEALAGELEDKAINVAKFLRNMEAMAEAIKNAEDGHGETPESSGKSGAMAKGVFEEQYGDIPALSKLNARILSFPSRTTRQRLISSMRMRYRWSSRYRS